MLVGIQRRSQYSPRVRVTFTASGILLAQVSSPQLNWWDGLVESWLNLPSWAQAGVVVGVIGLSIALVGSVVLWIVAAAAARRQVMSMPASIRYGWLEIPGWSKAVQFSLVGLVLIGAFSALSGRPAAELRVSPAEVVFGGVVTGGTARSDLVLTNLGTAGSPAIAVEQVTVSGEHAALFSVVAGADAVVSSGGDATVTISFSPESTGLKVADLQVAHSGANSPITVRLSGRGATVVRMNAGGQAIDDSPAWADDQAFLDTLHTESFDDAALAVSLSHPSIPEDVPSSLFQSARVSETSSLAYAFPVEPGMYEVRLFFAQLPDAVRSTLLDISVNDEAVVNQLNVADLAGPGAGLMVPIVVSSSPDTISVEIQSLLGSPWLNAIEIVDISQSTGSQLDAPADIEVGPVQMLSTVSKDVTLRNTGDRLLDPTVVISEVQLDGSTSFALDQLEATAVGHGNNARGSLVLTPTSTGPHEAVLSINHSGGANPHLITVTGFGWRASDDSAETIEDQPIVIPVLDNDGDPEGSVLTVSSVDRPSSGIATTDGLTVSYRPGLNFNGEVTFGYRLRDTNGAVAEASITVIVADVNDPPRAFANGPYIGSTGVPVSFSSAGSGDLDGTITRYSWTFGDGSSLLASNPTHIYANPGTYSVVLTVTDDDGATARSSTSVRIDPRLSVEKSGDGFGTVVTSPAGIVCGAGCSNTFAMGSLVTASATPTIGSVFVGWTKGCSGTGGCVISMNDDRTVAAEFRLLFDLSVNKGGTGLGTVTSTPAGINCGIDCAETLISGDTVTLTASAAVGSTFTGWSGACFGVGSCVVSMTQAKSVTATFALNSYTLTLSKGGLGSGTVTSLPVGISCLPACPSDSGTFIHGTSVSLTATAAFGSTFTGWSGAGCFGTGTCTMSMTQARSVTASFTPNSYLLSVNKNGLGTVTSVPGGINCGLDCSQSYSHGTSVSLTASASVGWTFTGWSGAGCFGTGTCTVSMTQARSVTASFTPNSYLLSVNKNGLGTVTSVPGGINCGLDCSQSYSHGTSVTLTASASVGWTFTGWSGAGCFGTGTCTVSMTQARSVTASFTINSYVLTVSKGGSGSGTVTSVPGGINCAAACSSDTASFTHGTSVTLTASASVGSTFTGWSGCSSPCTVSMTQARSVTASFTINSYVLTVSKGGSGSGTVTSVPGGINCAAACSSDTASFTHGTSVTLTASASVGSTFTGWSGCSSPCTVSMTQARSVTASFTINSYVLTVSKGGSGSGTVTSVPGGINCAAACSSDTASFTHGTSVTLTASASVGSTFTGWSGCSSPCTVSMTQARSVTASFTINSYVLTVSKGGSGSGTVTSVPGGINCAAACSSDTASFTHGTSVTLTASASVGSTFTGWSGCSSPCTVSMTQARSVTATFTTP